MRFITNTGIKVTPNALSFIIRWPFSSAIPVQFWIIIFFEQFHLNVKYPLFQLIYNTL